MTPTTTPARPKAPLFAAALLSAPLLAALACAPQALAQPAAFGGPKILIHGNYCGPGNNAPLPPVDALDTACARHDACTPRGGLPSRACNDRLQREADFIAHDPRQPQDVRTAAGFVAAGAVLIPSDPRSETIVVSGTGPRGPAVLAPMDEETTGSIPADEDEAGK